MNQDLFKPEVQANIIARINKLTPESGALWGKMNVSQMLEHSCAQMRVALGDEKLSQSFIGMLFGKWVKKKSLEVKPFSKNLPTVQAFTVKHQPDFEDTKNKLIGKVTRFVENAITKNPHPFFGKMTLDEWSTGTWKHLDHHLRQFGV